jgi:hypothetical protein
MPKTVRIVKDLEDLRPKKAILIARKPANLLDADSLEQSEYGNMSPMVSGSVLDNSKVRMISYKRT